MRLLSETLPLGLPPGPVFPQAYPEIEPDALSNVELFMQGQPFDVYARLRSQAPVAWQREGNNGPGFWALTRYNDVMRVDGDPKTFSSQKGGILMAYGPPETRHPLLFRASVDAMINMDAPWHLQLRKEHMPYFTPGYLDGIRKKVAAETTRLIDGMAGLGECDLVETLSSRLPLFTLCEILGVPEADRPKFLDWMHYLEVAGHVAATQRRNPQPTPEFMQFVKAFNENVAEMFAYGQHMLQKRRADPQAGPDERDRARHRRRRAAAQRISRRLVAADRVRRQRHHAQHDFRLDEAVDRISRPEARADGRPVAAAERRRRTDPHDQPGDLHAPHRDGGYRDRRPEDRRAARR